MGERKDSAFVTKCVDFLYDGKKNLLNRVATDVKVPVGKKPISPEKVEIVSQMLQERLNSEGLTDELSNIRFNRIRQLLNNAICTARKENARSKKSTPPMPPTQHLQPSQTMQPFNSMPYTSYQPIQQTLYQQMPYQNTQYQHTPYTPSLGPVMFAQPNHNISYYNNGCVNERQY